MQNSKLLRSLGILNAEEMKDLLSFLQSPYFNTNSNIIKLYRVLYPHYPGFKRSKITREKVFARLFSGKEYAHQQMLNLMSEFNRLIEKYLVVKQLEKEELLAEKLLLKTLFERPNCYNSFVKKFQQLESKIETSPYRDEIYFREKKDLNLMYYGHRDTKLQKGDKGTLGTVVDNFEAYKKLASLKLKCAKNARINTIKDKQIGKDITFDLLDQNPLLKLYEQLELFQRIDKPANFEELLSQFKSTIHLLRTEDQRNIFRILMNYCIRETNRGNADFFSIALELNKLGLKYRCLLIYGKITEATFQNIVTSGTMSKEFEWTENFMHEYQMLLDENIKSDAMAIAFGFWYFEQKEYHKAIDALQHSFKEPIDVFKSKSLLIRCWFELWLKKESYFDFLLNQVDAFEKFIRRDRSLTPKLKAAFLKFILYTKKIFNAPYGKGVSIKITQAINQEPNLVLKKWLLEKAQQK